VLFAHFLEKKSANQGKPTPRVHRELLDWLQRYNWPGNVRELENIVERLVHAGSEGSINVEHLPREIRDRDKRLSLPLESAGKSPAKPDQQQLSARQRLDEYERDELISLLHQYDGNVAKVAHNIGVSRNTVYSRMKKYQIPRGK